MFLIVLFLGSAFISALLDKMHRGVSLGVFYGTLVAALGIPIWQVWQLLINPAAGSIVYSAGFAAPLSISLSFGLSESILLSLINFMGVLGGMFLFKRFKEFGAQPIVLFMMILLGANGLVLTRDIFNSFVFLEILSIASYALIGVQQNKNSLAAGIKYMLAGGIASTIYLIGIVFAYRYTGTLNIDTWISMGSSGGNAYKVAVFLVGIGLLLELKPFPANGWALDLYQSADSGVGAMIASINTGATLFLFYKLMPLFSPDLLEIFAASGLVSFVFANLIAIRQTNAKRLLGYSSTAQTGLIIFALGSLQLLGLPPSGVLVIAFGLFVTNFFAKSGLLWLSGMVKKDNLKDWSFQETGMLIIFGIFLIALMGFPPFPSFFGKWNLVSLFAATKAWMWLGGLLLGSFLEAVYLFRWLSFAAKGKAPATIKQPVSRLVPVLLGAVVLVGSSLLISQYYPGTHTMTMLPVIGLMIFGLIEFFPGKLKGFIAIGALSAWAWFILFPNLPLMGQVFTVVLVGGSIVQIFAFMRHKGTVEGLYPLLTMMIFAMGNVVIATSKLELFIAWELMTISSYLLIIRGKKAQIPAYVYALFSTFGAYLLLTGLGLMPEFYPEIPLLFQAGIVSIGKVAALFAIMGFLIKMGAFGVHYWLPGAYSEAEDETSSLLSSVLSKAGVFGLMLSLMLISTYVGGNSPGMIVLGWLGVFTAFFGALMAVFQEDAKKLLAYSSMSQLGYIVIGFSLMSHLGWVSALYLTVNHLFFKGLIFMAMAGVFLRTGTRNMYEMGGLIKKMPIAFISVLIGIIAVSGVPPLSGFGSKWFIYTSLLEQGRFLQAGLVFFSSAIAFLYLYRLIHTIFLGQAKPNHRDVKEAPIWLIIPQGIFMMAIMAISVFPNLITQTLSRAVSPYIVKPDWISWNGYNIILNSPVLRGNWNGNLVMMVTMGVFIFPLLWLLLVNAKTQKVKQFNIVFAAERPYKPWTTHFAYNMFAPYQKALGFWVKPRATAFYQGLAEWTHSLSATLARLYTGNGQTYLLHLYLYMITLYLILGVKP